MVIIGERTLARARVFGSRSMSLPSPLQTCTQVDLTVEHEFSSGHRLALHGRQSAITPSVDGRELAYILEYSIPINIPVQKNTAQGQLSGRIIDVETATGIPNVIFTVGRATAVSDGEGRFLVPSLAPDSYRVQVDRASLGLRRITLGEMPFEVVVKGGGDSHIEIGVTRSASIMGSLIRYDFKGDIQTDSTNEQLIEGGGQPNIVIELSNGTERQRRSTDGHGSFHFSDLRPGIWRLKIVDGDPPPYHHFEKDSLDIEAMPGGVREVLVKILPKRRKIQILEGGHLIESPGLPGQNVFSTRSNKEGCRVFARPDKSGFLIEVSSWPTRMQALKEAASVEKVIGYKASVEGLAGTKGESRFVVQLGVFSTSDEAEAVCRQLRSKQ